MFGFGRRAAPTRFIPWIEPLEQRAVPATASIAAGVVTINGTSGADSIVLKQANGRVFIEGMTKTFAAANVNSIVVNARAGNDTISLSGLKNQPWAKPVTVNSGGGNDSVKLLDGRTVFVGAVNRALHTDANGDVTLNGQSLSWFDFSIRDAALRQLLKTDFADNALGRGDMIGVFNQAKKDGTVSSTEFNDLKKVANRASLFGSPYVADITRNVVVGNQANSKYQGTSLGNLSAGAPAAKLNKLVNKWFLGLDRPAASYPGITVTYVTAAGSLFGASGPQYTDVHQGAVGDCYFVAGLAEVAQENAAAITDMFIVNGDGTYGVRFYQNGNSRYVTVDSKLPTYSGGWFLYANMGSHASDTSNVLWVALAEKAYAQINESGWLRLASWGGGENSYAGIEGGLFSDAVRQIVNHGSSSYYVNGTSDETTLVNAINNGQLVGYASQEHPANPQIVENHQYIVISCNSSTDTVTLFNPWGINNGSQYPGLIDMPLSQLPANFVYWTIA
jgi:hypothetical protein